MTLGTYLLAISLATVFAWIAFFLTVFNLNPEFGFLAYFSFFSSLTLALIGTFSLLLFYLKITLRKSEIIYGNILPSFRQGLLLALFVFGILGMRSLKILNFLDSILFGIILILIEFYFQGNRGSDEI